MNSRVSIIILNWNGLKDTIECLESVKKIDYSNYEIIVVDNGSTDGSQNEIKRLFAEVALLENKENLGYAEGNNVGIRYALMNGAEYIFLLNNDTVVDSQILNSFIDVVNLYPEAGIFGAKIYYYSDPNKIWFAGGKLDSVSMRFLHIGMNQIDSEKFNRIQEIDYACGCALFIKKEVIDRIGLLEPSFFLTYEETDWCYRAKALGFKILLSPQLKVWHKISVSFGGNNSPLYTYFFTRNRLLWAKRNLPFCKRYHLYIAVIKEFFPCVFTINKLPLIKRIYWDILRIFQDRKDSRFKAKLFGVADFILNRFNVSGLRVKQFSKV